LNFFLYRQYLFINIMHSNNYYLQCLLYLALELCKTNYYVACQHSGM